SARSSNRFVQSFPRRLWSQPSPAGTLLAITGLQGCMKRNGLVTATAGPQFRTGCVRTLHMETELGLAHRPWSSLRSWSTSTYGCAAVEPESRPCRADPCDWWSVSHSCLRFSGMYLPGQPVMAGGHRLRRDAVG